MLELRDYQTECLEEIQQAEAGGIKHQLINLPTGCGKTIIFAVFAKERGERTLILAHRDELIEQAVDKYLIICPEADIGVVKAERNELDHQVIVASVQTLGREHRFSQLPTDLGLIITDEAHHAVASTYTRIYEYLGLGEKSKILHLGFTATPNRHDRKGLIDVFEEVVFERNIFDMIQAVYGVGGETHSQEIDLFRHSQLVWIPIGEQAYQLNLGNAGYIRIYTAFEDPGKYHVFTYGQSRDQLTPRGKPIDLEWAMGIAETRARRLTNGNLKLVDKNAAWRRYPASEKQIGWLVKLGIQFRVGITKGEASDLIAKGERNS